MSFELIRCTGCHHEWARVCEGRAVQCAACGSREHTAHDLVAVERDQSDWEQERLDAYRRASEEGVFS
jgi:hypothetical protein